MKQTLQWVGRTPAESGVSSAETLNKEINKRPYSVQCVVTFFSSCRNNILFLAIILF